MIEKPAKIVLTAPDGRHYIRYAGPKAKMMVEVMVFDSQEELDGRFDALAQWCIDKNHIFLCSETWLNDKHYLLVAVDIDFLKYEPTQEGANRLARTMRRLADWYRFTWLIPLSNGHPPILRSRKHQPENPI